MSSKKKKVNPQYLPLESKLKYNYEKKIKNKYFNLKKQINKQQKDQPKDQHLDFYDQVFKVGSLNIEDYENKGYRSPFDKETVRDDVFDQVRTDINRKKRKRSHSNLDDQAFKKRRFNRSANDDNSEEQIDDVNSEEQIGKDSNPKLNKKFVKPNNRKSANFGKEQVELDSTPKVNSKNTKNFNRKSTTNIDKEKNDSTPKLNSKNSKNFNRKSATLNDSGSEQQVENKSVKKNTNKNSKQSEELDSTQEESLTNDPFRRAKLKYMKQQESLAKQREEFQKITEAKLENKKVRNEIKKKNFKKTKKGQPIMKNQINHIMKALET